VQKEVAALLKGRVLAWASFLEMGIHARPACTSSLKKFNKREVFEHHALLYWKSVVHDVGT